jgi:CrcB protein
MNMVLSIAAGGAIGAVCRYVLAAQITQAFGPTFPWGILLVNVVGCFAMGLLAELALQSWPMNPEGKAFLMTGVLGGFTTFSAFALDTAVLTERGDMMGAMLYVMGSVGGSVVALFLGLYLVRAFSS